MTVAGELSDIEISSVIQVLCTERRQAGLVLRRRGEEGVMFFAEGQIVHAALGALEGDEAVYQLLTWRDGSFRMTNEVQPPARTVAQSWNQLLMEGMRKLDEGRRDKGLPARWGVPQEAAGALADDDAALESQLLLLLSQLEQGMVRLGEEKVRRRPLAALGLLGGMLDATAAAAEERYGVGSPLVSLEATLQRAARLHPLLRLVAAPANRVSLAAVASLLRGWSEDPAERRKVFHDLARGFAAGLETFLELLARRYNAAAAADAWRESYGVFLRELTAAIDRVRC